tara:strand:- start:12191 stop:12529 length:339 start_codon:yes stop_codon:yes gene_type:complete
MKNINPADNMYCMVSFQDPNNPKILEIQGCVWFANEDIAYHYWMMLKPELRDNDHAWPVLEENLDWHFNVGSDYIKTMKTKTRVTKVPGKDGVFVGQGYKWEEAVKEAYGTA